MVTHGGLSVRDLWVRYGSTAMTAAVAGVSLDVPRGEVLALLGPSGSGKSSLLRAVAGLEPVAGGTVRWDGQDVTQVPVHRRGFGLLFQDGQLFPHRSVAGNVAYGLAGRRRAEREARVAELLRLVGLEGYGPRAVVTLSGGQAQRVALARSLAPAPRLLLLDEPLSALDRGLRERLTGELRDILRATGTTALYVTHDHDEAFTVADRVAVLIDGRLAQVDAPARLWRAPVSREVAEFLGYGPYLSLPEARAVFGADAVPDGALDAVASADDASSPDDAAGLLGLGPDALPVVTGGDGVVLPAGTDGVVLPVTGTRFVRGRTEIGVRLPGGQPAIAVARGGTEPGDSVLVRLDPAGAVVVPAGEAEAGQ